MISVLWLLLLLSGLAATVTAIARIHALLTHRGLEVARGEAAADAVIIQTIGALSDEQSVRHPMLHNSVKNARFGDIPVTIQVSNEAGRIDINTGSDDLLLAFLQSQGLSQERAGDLLHDLRQLQGRDERSRGMSTDGSSIVSRSDRMLQAVEELRQIPSWRSERLECWVDSLTVYSQQADVYTGAATSQALAAVQWLRMHHGLDPLSPQTAMPTDEVSPIGGVFRIRASARVSSEVVVEREWVGRLTGDIHHPALAMLWSTRQSQLFGESCSAASGR